MDEIEKQVRRIERMDSANRTVFESQLMKLYEVMNLYQRLEVSLKPPGTGRFRGGTGRLPEKHCAGHRRRERP